MSMPRRSSSVALATIIAAVVTGIFTYLASRQILRVEVTLPDSGQETLSIKAASNKIEDLSRKLTLAESEVASLQERVSRGASSEEETGILLKRIKVLEEELEGKDRLIADLSQGSQHSADRELSRASSDPSQSRDHPSSLFRTRWFQVQVVSVEAAPEEIVLLAELRPVRDEAVKFQLMTNDTFVLDHQGNRWGGYGKVGDTLGVFAAPSVELLPGTSVRSRIRFEADVPRSARPPDPQPPFTLITEESHTQQRIVIEGLEPR